MNKWLFKHWEHWLSRKHKPQQRIYISRHGIYVLPSKFGNLVFLVILTLFIGSVNYQLSSGFFLTFLLVTLVMLSAWLGHQNLNGISFCVDQIKDTATNHTCYIPIQVIYDKPNCYAIRLVISNQAKTWPSIQSNQLIHMPFVFHKRGHHRIPRIRVETRFPFGLFVIWSYLTFDTRVYIYPYPRSPGFWPEPTIAALQSTINEGDEEFYSLRQSDNPWKQPSRISWTTAAKGYGWYEKQFTEPARSLYFFSMQQVNRFPIEEGLQFISYWLIESEKRGYDYAFHLQPISTASHGKAHLKKQLRQLAIYGQPEI